nr:MAG TPA: hypothetical protein [Caudoviricetes sp.]
MPPICHHNYFWVANLFYNDFKNIYRLVSHVISYM